MGDERDRLVEALEDVLERERALLLSGKVDGLSRIVEEKTALLAHLGPALGLAGLDRLRTKAARNARLLEAAGAGIRSVARRIAALQNGPEPLSTYSATGQRTSIGKPGGSVEKRA